MRKLGSFQNYVLSIMQNITIWTYGVEHHETDGVIYNHLPESWISEDRIVRVARTEWYGKKSLPESQVLHALERLQGRELLNRKETLVVGEGSLPNRTETYWELTLQGAEYNTKRSPVAR